MSTKFPIETTEKRTVKRITIKQTIIDFLDAFNVERGIVYTVKMLFYKPGMLIRYYLGEGRFKIVNAFRLLIITTALSLIVLSMTDAFQTFFQLNSDSEAPDEYTALVNQLYADWYNLMLWLSIPCFAFFSFLLFKKYESFNYAEHIVIVSFFTSGTNIIGIVLLPLGYFIGLQVAFILSLIISFLYYHLLFLDLFKKPGFGITFRAFLSYLLGNILYFGLFGILIALRLFDALVES